MDLISIIIPVYKVEKYIHRCVDSVVNQTYKNLEIILVDDGSPDNCGKICDEYAEKDNRIKVIHKENGGLSDARNWGIDAATGEWLFFIDSDDWMHLETIKKLYDVVIENDASVGVSGFLKSYGGCVNVDTLTQVMMCTPKDLFIQKYAVFTVAWAKLYKKDCFQNIRYPVGKIHEDEFVTYRILFAQEKLAYIDQPYYAYFMNMEGLSKKQWTPNRMDAIDAIEERSIFFEKMGDADLIEANDRIGFLVLVTNYRHAKELGFKRESRYLRRKVILKAIKSPRKLFSEQNIWVLENFFPRFMRCYWGVKAVFNKISGKSSR